MLSTRKLMLAVPALLFILACQTVLGPVNEVQNVTGTVQSIATKAIDISTEIVPKATAFAEPTQGASTGTTSEPGGSSSGNVFDPQGAPLSAWQDIPVMPGAAAGQEVEGIYSFKINASTAEVKAFYDAQLPPLGWTSMFSNSDMPFLVYSKDNHTLTITITEQNGSMIVLLTTA
jgi:hypothetical protein